jgi:hypothetical protein
MAWLRNTIPDQLSTTPLGLTFRLPNPQHILKVDGKAIEEIGIFGPSGETAPNLEISCKPDSSLIGLENFGLYYLKGHLKTGQRGSGKIRPTDFSEIWLLRWRWGCP